MFNRIKELFTIDKNAKNIPAVIKEKHEEVKNHSRVVTKTLGSFQSMHTNEYISICGNDREIMLTKNMDRLIEIIKDAIVKQPLLHRVIANISQKVINNGYTFTSVGGNQEKIKKVENRFKEILKQSNYTDKSFFKENILNLIKFSNSFVVPFRNEKTQQLEQVLIVQNKGWHVDTAWGTSVAKTFKFEPTDKNGNNKIYKNQVDVWHYTFNKESDEIYGMPLWVPVIPILRKYQYLISTSIDSYSDQSIEKTIYGIGVTKNGNVKPVNPEIYQQIRHNLENYPDDDLVADTAISVDTIKKSFSSPDKLIETLYIQVVAGLFTSKSQLGENGAGRQDAETQQENTESIVEDFKAEFQNFLNNTFIKEICNDLFGSFYGENEILFTFEDTFNTKERKEKHAVYLFQAGATDLDETRNACNLHNDINKEKTFFKLYQQKEMSGTVQSTNNPTNQHGTTHTTKKTKKD